MLATLVGEKLASTWRLTQRALRATTAYGGWRLLRQTALFLLGASLGAHFVMALAQTVSRPPLTWSRILQTRRSRTEWVTPSPWEAFDELRLGGPGRARSNRSSRLLFTNLRKSVTSVLVVGGLWPCPSFRRTVGIGQSHGLT